MFILALFNILKRRHDIQRNNTQLNDHDDIQHYNQLNMTLSITTPSTMEVLECCVIYVKCQ
jgi:hypothetical protein